MKKISREEFELFLQTHNTGKQCDYHQYECPRGLWYVNERDYVVKTSPNKLTCCDSLKEKFIICYPQFKDDVVLNNLENTDVIILYILQTFVKE
jgi:hypothetical protein